MAQVSLCYCGSGVDFQQCCEQVIDQDLLKGSCLGLTSIPCCERLMRSRFTAYVLKQYNYIASTYATNNDNTVSARDIADSAKNTLWIGLKVINSTEHDKKGKVEFYAYYKEGKRVYQMHEKSNFIVQNEAWRYHDGDIECDSGIIKVARNDRCLCQSNKKYKHCCINKVIQ